MRQKQRKTLTDNQKKRIIQWDIPHLVYLLEEKYQLSVMHLITPVFFPLSENSDFHHVESSFSNKRIFKDLSCLESRDLGSCFHRRGWLKFNGKTGFPVFLGKDSFGLLIFFDALSIDKAHCVRIFIDDYFQKLFKSGADRELTSKNFTFGSLESGLCEVCVRALREKAMPLKESEKQPENTNRISIAGLKMTKKGEQDQYKSLFPLLLQREQKEGLLKTAHDIYLKTSAFAFLNSEVLQWKEGVFQEMKGVFICVPSFHKLSIFQKKILTQSLLRKKLPCQLVVGVKKADDLPIKWQKFFHFVL